MIGRTPETIWEFLDFRTEESPRNPLMAFHDRWWTWQEVRDWVWTLASAYQEAGLKPGDRLLGVFDKSPEAVLCFLSAMRAGIVFVPINPQVSGSDFENLLQETQPRMIVASHGHLPRFESIEKQSSPDKADVPVYSANLDSDDKLGQIIRGQHPEAPSINPKSDDIAYLNYTSGTTGKPRGAVTTHRHILENTYSVAKALKLQPGDVHLCMFPIHTHPHEIVARAIILGGSFVLLDSIHPRTIAAAITQHRITCMMGVTPMYRSLLSVAASPDYDFSSLRVPESGGMDSPISFIEEFQHTFGRRYLPVWGSTETCGVAIATPTIGDTVPGSLGRPCPGYTVQIVDENGNNVEGAGEGEMWVKGPAVVSEYWNRPDATEAAFRDGWYRTGDIVRREDGDFYTFQGRMNGIMKVGGMKVSPLEIERVLAEHPDVEESVVIGAKDRMKGEIPKAYIITKKGTTLTRAQLRKHCQQQLPAYKIPKRFEFREDLPRTPSGKPMRLILQATESSEKPRQSVTDLRDEMLNLDRRILALLNQRSQLLEQDTQSKSPIVIQEEYLQRVLDANEGPLYDDVAETLLKQIHTATRFPGGK
jgi:long-chain acyl-CoA synthetase